MPNRPLISLFLTGLLTGSLLLSAAPRPKRLNTGPKIDRNPAPQPGYLNRGAPYKLRKGARSLPPVYALPALPINPDPQPLPLVSSNPAQPLNAANGTNALATIPAMPVTGTPPFKVEAQSHLLTLPTHPLPGIPTTTGGAVDPAVSSFLNPQILRYFNADANGTYQSRILLNGSSLFTLPTMNPLLQRGSSATYQIK